MSLKSSLLKSFAVLSAATVCVCALLFTGCAAESSTSETLQEIMTTKPELTETVTATSEVVEETSDGDPCPTVGTCDYEDIVYTLDKNGLLTVSGTGTVDSTWKCFLRCDAVKQVEVRDGVTGIGPLGFSDCENLEDVSIAYGVCEIESRGFRNCKSLTGVYLPETVETISSFAFENCIALECVTIPPSVIDIDDLAFEETGDVTIYGSSGSYAEIYAYEHSIPFYAQGTEYPSDSDSFKYGETENNEVFSTSPVETSISTTVTTVTSAETSTAKATTSTSNTKEKLNEADVSLSETKCLHTGKAVKPKVTIKGLTEGTDFTVTYTNNVNAGTATATVRGKGNYTGTVTKKFEIVKADDTKSIAGKVITLSSTAFIYTGKEITPKVTISGLKENVDFVVLLENNVNVGKGTVKVAGIDKYSGTVEKTFTIKAKALTQSDIKLSKTSYDYTGNEIKPEIKIGSLKIDKDYMVAYSNNIDAGTATVTVKGIGQNCTGTARATFKIVQTVKSIDNMTAVLSETSATYTGSKIKPKVTIQGLTQDKDFTVEYSDNVNVGTATVTITGINKYKGRIVKTFKISARTIVKNDVMLSESDFPFTGEEIMPEVTIEGLEEQIDYSVTYSNNVNVGTATITVRGIGNCKGTVKITFPIYMPKTDE